MTGRKCGLSVVCKGLETDDRRGLLSDRGGTLSQGYLFAKPMSAASLTDRYFDND